MVLPKSGMYCGLAAPSIGVALLDHVTLTEERPKRRAAASILSEYPLFWANVNSLYQILTVGSPANFSGDGVIEQKKNIHKLCIPFAICEFFPD